jgi:hypothetical protein
MALWCVSGAGAVPCKRRVKRDVETGGDRGIKDSTTVDVNVIDIRSI